MIYFKRRLLSYSHLHRRLHKFVRQSSNKRLMQRNLYRVHTTPHFLRKYGRIANCILCFYALCIVFYLALLFMTHQLNGCSVIERYKSIAYTICSRKRIFKYLDLRCSKCKHHEHQAYQANYRKSQPWRFTLKTVCL